MVETKPVACRLHPKVDEQLEKVADERRTSKARLMEEWVREKLDEIEAEEEEEESEESTPKGVYVPDSHKYNYAVTWYGPNGTERKYYKTLEGAEKRAKRVRRSDDKSLARG